MKILSSHLVMTKVALRVRMIYVRVIRVGVLNIEWLTVVQCVMDGII